MKLFIFGAGASAASQINIHGETLPADSSQKSPLVNELFDNRYLSYFQSLGFSFDQFKEFAEAKKPDASIEQWLTKKWDGIKLLKTPTTVKAERTDLGKISFYLWWMLQNVLSLIMASTFTEGC